MSLYADVSAIRLFGSAARGDADSHSDIDVLVVQRRRLPEVLRSKIQHELVPYGDRVSISWYSESSITRIFDEGHLFATHLVKESVRLLGSSDFIDRLGVPRPYSDGLQDLEGFQMILEGVTPSLTATPKNAIFEAGLLYVCARNIAMIASAHLPAGPFFGRNSPFDLAKETGIKFPLTKHQHRSNMLARTAGQRGIGVVARETDVFYMAAALSDWSHGVRAFAAEMELVGER